MKGFLRGPSASEHRRTSVPAPAKVSALSHMGLGVCCIWVSVSSHTGSCHRCGVLRPLFRTLHGLLGYQRSSTLFRSDMTANPGAASEVTPPSSTLL